MNFLKTFFTVTIYLILFSDRVRCCSEIMRVNFTVVFVVFELLEMIRGQSVVKSQRPSVGWGEVLGEGVVTPTLGVWGVLWAPQRCPGQNHHHSSDARWLVAVRQKVRVTWNNPRNSDWWKATPTLSLPSAGWLWRERDYSTFSIARN